MSNNLPNWNLKDFYSSFKDETISKDLDKNWAVVSEAIQTILRREKVQNPYEILKDLMFW